MIGIAAGATLFAACSSGDDGGDDDGGGDCVANGTTVTIGSNHNHALVVTTAEVSTAADKTYDIHGTADHTHTVKITAALFAMLKSNTGIQVTSSTDDGHSHQINIGCA